MQHYDEQLRIRALFPWQHACMAVDGLGLGLGLLGLGLGLGLGVWERFTGRVGLGLGLGVEVLGLARLGLR